jgi:hypothetical protein
MARNVSNRGRLGLVVTVVVLGGLAAVAIWQSLQQSTNPDYQIRTERAGTGEYFVNLWTDPHPPVTGEVEFTVRLTTIIGTPMEVATLEMDVVPPDDGETRTLETDSTIDSRDDGAIYHSQTTFDQTGTWLLVVRYSFGATEVRDEFTLEVSE